MLGIVVAKKQTKASKPTRDMVVGIRGTEAWNEWLGRFAEHCRLSKVTLIDLALVDYAKKMDFELPPKR